MTDDADENPAPKNSLVQATFVDFKNVKTRKAMQLIFEVPIERAKEAMDILGYPDAGKELWNCIVPLVGYQAPPKPPTKQEGSDALRRAIMLCKDPRFQEWMPGDYPCNEAGARDYVCFICGIESRKELQTDRPAYDKFVRLEEVFYTECGQLPKEPRT